MITHFSILGVILLASLLWENNIRCHKLRAIHNGDSYDFKSDLTPWLLVFGYVAFLAAMRTNVNDSLAYIISFKAQPGTWDRIFHIIASKGKDKAFDITANLFKMFISDDYHMWFAFFAVVESAIFISVLRRSAVSFLDACFVFFSTTLYYNYFSMMRQWAAIVLLFWGSKFIKEKRTLPYMILCVFAAQFHNSAYLFLFVYFIVRGKAWSTKQNLLIVGSAIGMAMLSPVLNGLQTALEGTTYDYVVDTMLSNSGSSIVRPLIAVVPVALAYVNRTNIDPNDSMVNISINMSLLNLLLNILAVFTSGLYVIRLSTYMAVYNMLLYPYLLNVTFKSRNRKLMKLCFYALHLAFYCYQMSYQGAWGYKSDVLTWLTN